MNINTRRVTTIFFGCLIFVLAVNAPANLIVNGSFEEASPTGWTGGFNTYSHTSSVYYAGPAPAGAGDIYGWAWSQTTMGSVTQIVDLTGKAGQGYIFGAWLSSWTADADYSRVSIEFFDGAGGTGGSLGSVEFDGNNGASSYIVGSANSSGVADPSVGWTQDNWTFYRVEDFVPGAAVSAVVTLSSDSAGGNGNDSYVDLVSFETEQAWHITITESGSDTTVEEGGATDSYQVSLSMEPSATVTVTAMPADSQIDLGEGAGVAKELTFTAGAGGNWDQAQTVTVTAFDDDVYEGDEPHITVISHSAVGGDYTGIEIDAVEVSVIDNEEICGDWGFFLGDLNEDCYVNLLDFAMFAEYWLAEGGV